MDERFKVIFIQGATATGKSDWAFQWAQDFGGFVFNCDSVQVYQGLDIGAAKPRAEEMSRVPHFLYDVVQKGENLTAGEYRRLFFSQLEEISNSIKNKNHRFNFEKNKISENKIMIPIFVVGGTGFYFQALEKGMYPARKVDPEIAKKIDQELSTSEGVEKLYQELKEKDPLAAQKIHINDSYRIGRALEVIRTEGRPLSEIQNEFSNQMEKFPYPLLKMGVTWPKEKLRERVTLRVDRMFEKGFLKEVSELLNENLSEWRALGSVGYKECVEFLQAQKNNSSLANTTDLIHLKEKIVQSTMALVKKQKTWFQRDSTIQWFDGETEQSKATEVVQHFIKKI